MSQTAIEYAFKTEAGGWRVTGTRVSLDSVVIAYLDGESPETICESYPTLSLEQAYGAIAFYLRHKEEMDAYLKDQEALWEKLAKESEERNGPLLERLRKYRETMNADSSSS